MLIPHTQLLPMTLRSVVLEFVTRDGTDHSNVESRVQQILAQLAQQRVVIDFDAATQTCNVVPKSPD
ncbi:YheU family protein [Lacipirellula parvula]|uniref:YheU family protein n=1 Tax=Lacipirellula parvula TaxID=2650471 RepID=UPI0021BC6488|nr:YheU family protein [Lacipirellula parvula]